MAGQQNGDLKKTIYLTLALLIAAGFIAFNEFYLKKQADFPLLPNLLQAVNIDYAVLEGEVLNNLEPFEEITLPEEVGRDNPFEPVSD